MPKLPDSTEEPHTTSYSGLFAGAFLGFALGVLGNLFAAWIQQDLLANAFTPARIAFIVLVALIGLFIAAWLERRHATSELIDQTGKTDIDDIRASTLGSIKIQAPVDADLKARKLRACMAGKIRINIRGERPKDQ